jgi:hypothetical protein
MESSSVNPFADQSPTCLVVAVIDLQIVLFRKYSNIEHRRRTRHWFGLDKCRIRSCAWCPRHP